ncbi:MAG: TetR/AcrR family transcriptional regulator [Limnochordia bacterium]|jgi:TetR/AcrR family transcriptional regulator|nr:TetR/AcrR family transcriptional regulator [Limnochordia bacterium]MDD2630688.1 TetR/AcrR family transcriptional regulator [Limnochordia bacterium]
MAQSKYEQILNAAMTLFLSRGISNVTMDDIAEAAPASKMTVYRYFQNKERLIEASMMRALEQVEDEIQELIDQAPSPQAALVQIALERTATMKLFSDAFILDLTQNYPKLVEVMLDHNRRRILPRIEALIFAAQGQGQIRKGLSPHVIMLFLESMKLFFARSGCLKDTEDAGVISGQIVQIFLHGILSKPHT